MKQSYYVWRNIINTKGNSLIKIISLTLGLAVAVVLFSKVAFEMSYDKFYPDVDRLYRLQRVIHMEGEQAFDGPIINYPAPGAMKNDLHEVENAVVMQYGNPETSLLRDNITYKEKMMVVDSTFFDIFGFDLIEGDKKMLGVASNVFLSESASKRIFGNMSPVGQTLQFKNDASTITVAGVFKDIPDNSHLEFDMLLSLQTYRQHWGDIDIGWWVGRDSYVGYLKLSPGAKPEEVEAKLPAMLDKYYDIKSMLGKDVEFTYFLNPVKDIHSGNETMKRMLLILTLLGFSLLFVSAMNYVLISISSLASRAKSVGVHKCNGATNGSVFSMFIQETAIQVGISLILTAILLFAFRGQIEGLLQNSFNSLFSLSNLWVILVIVVVLLLLAGVLPASIFSAIPVTQVFRAKTANKRYWKQVLLFIQFSGIAFVICLLIIIVRQYDMMINKDLGYTTENILVSQDISGVSKEKFNLLKSELERIPQVSHIGISWYLPMEGGNGEMVMDEANENMIFSTRQIYVNPDYIKTFDIQVIAGTGFPNEITENFGRVLINEAFVKMIGWTDSPIGKTITLSGGRKFEVLGLVKNYQLTSLHTQKSAIFRDIPPLMIFPMGPPYNSSDKMILRVNHLDAPLQVMLSNKLKEITDNNDAYFKDYKSMLDQTYLDARLFRDSILVASLLMLVITLLGLIGYVADEISRRSKEIAIRKINGATATNILWVISKDVMLISLPAIVIGLMASYLVGNQWLMQFAVKIPLTVLLFMTSGLVVLFIILVCVAIRAWNVANDNPVNSIKAE